MFHPATAVSVSAFLSICVFVLAALAVGVWQSARRAGVGPLRRTWPVVLGAVGWLALIGALFSTGWAEGSAPRSLLFVVMLNLVSLGFGLSPIGRWLAGSSLAWPVGFQAFRLPLELVLHSWVGQVVIREFSGL